MRDSSEETDQDDEAPPYAIVRACRRLGFQSPEDVRWRRWAPSQSHRPAAPRRWKWLPPLWEMLLGRTPPRNVASAGCGCQTCVPTMHRCTFTMSSGREVAYLIGQCPRCRTIIWQPA